MWTDSYRPHSAVLVPALPIAYLESTHSPFAVGFDLQNKFVLPYIHSNRRGDKGHTLPTPQLNPHSRLISPSNSAPSEYERRHGIVAKHRPLPVNSMSIP